MAITNKELNLFPLMAGAGGRLPGGLMRRGLLKEFQVTAEENPTTVEESINPR